MKFGVGYIDVRAKKDKLPGDLRGAESDVKRSTSRMQKSIGGISFAAVGIAATAFAATVGLAMRKTIKDELKPVLASLAEKLEDLEEFDDILIEDTLRNLEEDSGLSEGKLNRPFRVAITGSGSGADLVLTAAIIGREKVISRLKNPEITV